MHSVRTNKTSNRLIRRIRAPNLSTPVSKAVGGGFSPKVPAISLRTVLRPVRQTNNVALPLITEALAKAALKVLSQCGRRLRRVDCLFLNRTGFARHQSLIDEEIIGLEQSSVSRNEVAGNEPHHVARNELVHR